MTIEEFHINIREYLNPGQSRSRAPETIDSAINSAVTDLFNEEMLVFERTQVITDKLGFFKSYEQKDVTGGEVALPATMHHLSDIQAVMSDNTTRPLTEIKDESWTERITSAGYAPTARNPLARQASGKLFVLPKVATGVVGVNKVGFYFLRKPSVAKFNYDTVDGYGFAYKSSGSVEVDWPPIDHNRIMLKALGYLGIPVNNQNAIQAEQIKRATGA